MADTSDAEVVLRRLLDRHGRTYADEVGIDLRDGGPDALFQLAVMALLLSARIGSGIALAAARVLFDRGYTSASAMAAASWPDRVDALGASHYVRYDESTATYLGDTAELVLDRYDGDLAGLRAEAGGDPAVIHRLIQRCKGIGRVGADIFCREAQAAWAELRPYADDAALEVAAELGLPGGAEALAELHGDDDLSVVTAALLRARLAGDVVLVRDGQGGVDRDGTDDRDADGGTPPFDELTRDELYRLAQERDVAGRSSMTKAELADALRR